LEAELANILEGCGIVPKQVYNILPITNAGVEGRFTHLSDHSEAQKPLSIILLAVIGLTLARLSPKKNRYFPHTYIQAQGHLCFGITGCMRPGVQ
jgi:hypothetical protein